MKLAPAADAEDGAESATTATRLASNAARAHIPRLIRSVARAGLVLDQRCDFVTRELVAAFERGQLDQECETDDLALELFHELDGPGHRAPSCEEIVDDQDASARLDRVLVHLERRRTVFQVVLDADDIAGELSELAHWDKPDAELVGDRGREDKAPRLHADDGVDLLRADLREESVDRGRKRVPVLKERRNVLEEDARLGEVGNVTDPARERACLYRHDTESNRGAQRQLA